MFAQAIKFFKTFILCLSLLAGNSAFAAELITNGSFEDGSGWTNWTNQINGVNRTDAWWNILDSKGLPLGLPPAYSGIRHQYLGAGINGVLAANNVDGLLYQTVTIPAGTTSATLSYYLRISTDEAITTGAVDHLCLEIRSTSGSLLATYACYSNTNASQFASWTQQTVNLSIYAGQTIRVTFRGTTNTTLKTVFRIDDVSLQATGTTATAPTIRNLSVTLITATSATVNFEINPNGSSTSAYLECGTTTGYGTSSGSVNVGSGTSFISNGSFPSMNIAFSPSAVYHCRVVATNSGGTTYGSDVSFQTLPLQTLLPDITASWVVPDLFQPGYQWRVQTEVRNLGGATAGASLLKFYLSTDLIKLDIDLNASCSVPALDPAGGFYPTYVCTKTLDVSSVPTGYYYVVVSVDALGVIIESTKQNNIVSASI